LFIGERARRDKARARYNLEKQGLGWIERTPLTRSWRGGYIYVHYVDQPPTPREQSSAMDSLAGGLLVLGFLPPARLVSEPYGMSSHLRLIELHIDCGFPSPFLSPSGFCSAGVSKRQSRHHLPLGPSQAEQVFVWVPRRTHFGDQIQYIISSKSFKLQPHTWVLTMLSSGPFSIAISIVSSLPFRNLKSDQGFCCIPTFCRTRRSSLYEEEGPC
jgi:hypothetical protein